MKRRLSKHIGALLIVAVMLLVPLTSAFAAQEQSYELSRLEELLKRPEALITKAEFTMLVNNVFQLFDEYEGENFLDVPDDHPYAADMLRAKVLGYIIGDGKGYASPDAAISGAEAAVIVNRFLGFDGSKVNQANVAIPAWSVPSASILLDLTMVEADLIEKKQLTVDDAVQFLQALSIALMFQGSPYALTQTSLQDDFFAYVNRQFLATATIPPGYMYVMSLVDTAVAVDMQLQEILNEILSESNWAEGSDEWKISELYKMYLDNDSRTASLSKVQPYLDEIRAARTIEELIDLAKKYSKYFSIQPLYSLSITRDAKVDATKWCAVIFPTPLDLGSWQYYIEDESLSGIQTAYKDLVASMLAYIGETDNLESRAEAIYKVEKDRSTVIFPNEAYSDPYLLYTDTTWEAMLEATSVTQTLKICEEIYEIAKDFPIYCPEPEYVAFVESLYTEDNLQILKDLAMLNVLSSFASMLGDDFDDLSDGLKIALYGGIGEKKSLEQRAQDFVISMMSQAFSRFYADRYSSGKIKKDVTDMIEEMKDKYRDRIMDLTWMSEKTKLAAIEKLDAIEALVAYPDEPIEAVSYDVRAKDDGGCLIDLYFSVSDVSYDENINMIQKPFELSIWKRIPTSTVNAFYSPTDNAIIIPAGILQGVFYDVDAPREQNMGGIGAVIAHEITHAFDNSGAQYDKYGTLTDWWTNEDYVAFGMLTASMDEALSAIAFIGDIHVNGILCTGEAIADLGALACVLDIVNDTPNADLAKVMESWASVWAARMSPEMVVYLLYMDSHPPNKTRVNFILSQMDEFYEVFGVTESDGMYIPKDERLIIW